MDTTEVIRQIAGLLAGWGTGDEANLRKLLGEALADLADADATRLAERIATTGGDWGFHPGDPVGRRLSRFVLGQMMEAGSRLHDGETIDLPADHPVVFVGNHLSFVDANVLDALLARAGASALTDALTVLVGPKVYATPMRRLASLCFGTIKIPQSTSRASGEAVMSRREVARLAAVTLKTFAERQAAGDSLLIFVEGTRSRTGEMQRVLAATARYVETPGCVIVPFGLWGSEKLVPLEEDGFHPAEVHARLGPVIDAETLREGAGRRRPVVSDTLGFLIANLLPAPYRGFYASAEDAAPGSCELARELAP